MPRPPRSPLLLAAVLALVPIVALVVALGPLHHATPTATPQPQGQATASSLPQLVVADRFDLAAPRAFGPVDVTGIDEHAQVDITGYTLAAGLPALPTSAPVWRLRGFAEVNTTALQARLGVSPPTPEFPGDKFDGLIDLSQGRVSAGGGSTTTMVNAGVQPTDAGSAITAAGRVLSELGILPQNADARALHTVDGWDVAYARRPIQGIPVGVDASVAQVDISPLGNVTRLFVDAPSLDGGAPYPLRSVQDAWADVSRGHWLAECCAGSTGAPPGSARVAFHADTVSLAEVQLDPPAMLLVPMYVFTDTAQHLSLTLPALQAADLSEPGGFRLTEPGAQ